MRKKIFVLFSTIITLDLIFTLNSRLKFFAFNNLLVDIFVTLVAILKAIFFIPVIIFEALSGIATLFILGDHIYIPTFWFLVIWLVGLGYSFYLSGCFSNPSKRYSAVFSHAIITSIYLFLVGTLLIIWYFNPHADLPVKDYLPTLLVLGGLTLYLISAMLPILVRKKLRSTSNTSF